MNSGKIDQRKDQAKAWFETLRDRIVAAFEALEDALPATAPLADRPAGRFVRTPWSRPTTPARRRRRRHGDDEGPRLRKGRRPRLDGIRRIRAGIPQGHSGRRRRSALLRLRHFADRAHAQSACAGRAHEYALRGDDQIVVRRRRRFDAGVERRRARTIPNARFSCRDAGRLRRAFRRRALREIQKMVRRYFFLKHRNEMRGVGGIFYDYLETE